MGDQAQVDSNDNPSALLDDPIFSAVHDAFQLGWSIIELKSRIQIAALSTSITGTPQATSTTVSSNADQNQTSQTLPEVLTSVVNAKKQLLMPESQQNPTALPDNAWLTSLWRATFNRIAESHKSCFPSGSTTEGTLYDLPVPPGASQQENNQAPVTPQQTDEASPTYVPYVYLYPTSEQDYANVGIHKDDSLSGFRLYDVTRRAMNCLTLLYTNTEESLIPLTVADYQKQLMMNVLQVSQRDQNNTIQAEQLQVNLATPPSNEQITSAIQILSTNAISYLETWDTYARECLYVSGGEDAQADEIQLVAYEAGRSMASLSWGISTTIVPIENALNQAVKRDPSINQAVKNDPGMQQHLENAWLKVFDESSIASIQRRISALSTAMDNAYYRTHPGLPHPNPNDPEERTNLALPSQSIQAVTFSLDYWKRAIQLICNKQPGTNAGPSAPGRSKSQTIPSMTPQTSSQLRLALVQQAEIWQPLLLHQQSLLDFTTQYVTQRIVNDFMGSFERAISTSLQKEFRKHMAAIIVGGLIVLLTIGFIVYLLINSQNQLQNLVSASVFIVGSIVGFVGTFISRLSSFFTPTPSATAAVQERASSISAIPGLAGTALVEAFQNGYKEILIDFDYLNHNISITYPLVEYFISQSLANPNAVQPIKDAYDFLTQIAWTSKERSDEIQRIAQAAFGPIGAFVGAQISPSPVKNK